MPAPESESDRNPVADANLLLAAERTMLAWIRTGIAMIGFGFVVARFGLFLRTLGPGSSSAHGGSLFFGAALTFAGAVATAYGAVLYRRRLTSLERGEALHPHDARSAALLGFAIAVVGIALAIYLSLT